MLFLRRIGLIVFFAAATALASQAAALQMTPLPTTETATWQAQAKKGAKKGGSCFQQCLAVCSKGALCTAGCSRRCGK